MEANLPDGWIYRLGHTVKAGDRQAFVIANTAVAFPALLPELRLHLANEAIAIWQHTETELAVGGLPPPFWSFAWAGGQALARYVLDHPETVKGKSGIDLASGSGIVGIAAMMAGAQKVVAGEIDGFATAAITLNAKLNGTDLSIVSTDLLATDPPPVDFILVGDFFYEQKIAARLVEWLYLASSQGTLVLVGDPGRAYFPKDGFLRLAEYSVPVSLEVEDSEIKRTGVWKMQAP